MYASLHAREAPRKNLFSCKCPVTLILPQLDLDWQQISLLFSQCYAILYSRVQTGGMYMQGGNTALHRAAMRSNGQIAQLLLDKGASVDVANKVC